MKRVESLDPALQKAVAGWESRGFEVETWSLPAGGSWASEGHEADEYLVVLEGQLDVSIDGVTHRPPIGEPLLVPEQTRHVTSNPGATPTTLLWAHGYTWDGERPDAKGRA